MSCRTALKALMDQGGWFMVQRPLILKLGLEQAVVLHFLMNLGSMVGTEEDDWFFCTMDKMESELGLSRRTQDRLLKSLIKQGMLETSLRGIPSKRHFRIRWDAVDESLSNVQPRVHQNVQPKEHQNVQPSNKNYLNKNTSFLPTEEREGARRKRRPTHEDVGFVSAEFDLEQADTLIKTLGRFGSDLVIQNGRRRPVRKDTLTKQITRLRMDRNIPKEEIRTVIDWLYHHYGDPYTPKLHKADDLYKNWAKLKDARTRHRDGLKRIVTRSDDPRVWMDDETWEDVLLARVRHKCREAKGHDYKHKITQEECDAVLIELGHDPGELKVSERGTIRDGR